MKYSVVIPLKNEQDSIGPLLEEVCCVMQTSGEPWEVITVDDGSSDQTFSTLCSLKKRYKELVIISFDRNYGQTSAMDAGFREAQGEWVITLDGDGQNNPQDIPKLLALKESYDLVVGIRTERKDTLSKRFISKLANQVRSYLLKDQTEDTGCSLKVYRKEALNKVCLYEGMHRFLPALFRMQGLEVGQVKVSHRPRLQGTSHYHFFNRSFNTLYDLLAVLWLRKRTLRYKVNKRC